MGVSGHIYRGEEQGFSFASPRLASPAAAFVIQQGSADQATGRGRVKEYAICHVAKAALPP